MRGNCIPHTLTFSRWAKYLCLGTLEANMKAPRLSHLSGAFYFMHPINRYRHSPYRQLSYY